MQFSSDILAQLIHDNPESSRLKTLRHPLFTQTGVDQDGVGIVDAIKAGLEDELDSGSCITSASGDI